MSSVVKLIAASDLILHSVWVVSVHSHGDKSLIMP